MPGGLNRSSKRDRETPARGEHRHPLSYFVLYITTRRLRETIYLPRKPNHAGLGPARPTEEVGIYMTQPKSRIATTGVFFVRSVVHHDGRGVKR